MIYKPKKTLFATALCLSLLSCTASTSLNWSWFQGLKLSSGSASTRVANGLIQLNWQRGEDNRITVSGNLDFKLEKLYLRLMRNQTITHQEIVTPDENLNFSTILPDPQFAQQICVETSCFQI
jgi:hypothetical protein